MKSVLTLLFIALFFTSCSNFVTHIDKKKNMPPVENDRPIYVLSNKYDELPGDAQYVGDLVVEMHLRSARSGGGYPNSYELLSVIEDDIKEVGGNLLMVNEFGNSNRDMLNGKLYLISEIGKTNYTEKILMEELENKELKPIEGIYLLEFLNPYSKRLISLKFGVIEVSESKFQMIHLSGFEDVTYMIGLTQASRSWEEGDIYGYINTTEKDNLYEAQMYKISKGLKTNGTAKIDNKNLRIYSNDILNTYVKVYPDSGKYEVPRSLLSGVALDDKNILTSYNGLIETDLEVYVKGIGGDFKNKYKAQIVAKDKQLDLAVIRLLDSTVILNQGVFPITEKEKLISEKALILGYTMPTMMSDDIKLIEGLISSTSGVGGSLNEYQISAPVKKGNRGSPCFDKEGNFIGIINSGVVSEDNVGYLLKTKHVADFLKSQNITFSTVKENDLSGLPLVSKVEKLKKAVYLIELTDMEPPIPPERRYQIR